MNAGSRVTALQERARLAMKTPVSSRLAAVDGPGAQAPATPAVEVPDGTVADVLAWVGDDTARAQAAYAVEAAKSAPRSSLLTQLEAKGVQAA